MHNNVVYSPVMLYDYASMKGDFKTIGSDVFERGGVFYSLVDINGSKALQPIGAGGDQGFFGAYKGLSDAERTTLATHLLGRVQSGDEKSADAVRFLLPRMNEAEVEKNPESWRALSALVAADAALKPPGSKEALEKLDKYLAAAPPPAAPPSVDAGGHKKED